jgi:hypothetical protein
MIRREGIWFVCGVTVNLPFFQVTLKKLTVDASLEKEESFLSKASVPLGSLHRS